MHALTGLHRCRCTGATAAALRFAPTAGMLPPTAGARRDTQPTHSTRGRLQGLRCAMLMARCNGLGIQLRFAVFVLTAEAHGDRA